MSAVADGIGRRAQRRRRRVAAAASGIDFDVLGIGYVLVGLALATALAWPVFETWRLVVVALFGGVVGAGIAVAARARHWSLPVRVLAVVVAYLAGVVLVAVPSSLASPSAVLIGLRDGITGVALGWKQLLTLDLPVGDYQAVLVPFLVVALVGTTCATTLALSVSRVAELAVPLVLSWGVFGIAFGRTDPGAPATVAGVTITAPSEVLYGSLLVAVSIAWLVMRSHLRRRAALTLARSSTSTVITHGSAGVAVRRRILGAAILVVAIIAGLAVVPATQGVTLRSTLRTGSEPRIVLSEQNSPLTTYRASFTRSAYTNKLFALSGDTSGVDRIPMAVLSDWNGQVFTTGSGDAARFTRLPGGTAAAGAHAVTVTIQDDAGIWMPIPAGVQSAPVFHGDRAAALSDAFYLDRSSGAAIDVAGSGRSRGLRAGDSYTVAVASSTRNALDDPGQGGTISARSYPQLAAWVKAQSQPRTAAGFEELISRLRARGYLSHSLENNAAAATWVKALKEKASSYAFQSSYAGHSRSRIESLFEKLNDRQKYAAKGKDSSALVSGIGDDEQFAVAGALIARYLGYDSRVVLGVRTSGLSGSGVPACTSECTGKNLAAWIQVKSPTATDWTTVDVEPQYRKHPVLVRVGEQLPKNPTIPEQNQASTAQSPSNQHDGRSVAAHNESSKPSWVTTVLQVLRVVGIVLLVVLLLLLPMLVLLVAKRVRRRRRSAAPVPEVAVLGAWAETFDVWIDARVPVAGQTRTAQAASVGSEDAARLAALVDAAVFAEHPPTKAAVDEAWRLGDAERDRLRADKGIWRRLLLAVTPRSLARSLFPRGGGRRRNVIARVRRSFGHDVIGPTALGMSVRRKTRERTIQ